MNPFCPPELLIAGAIMAITPYETGQRYFREGKGFLDNPYPEGSVAFRRYVDGVADAISAASQTKPILNPEPVKLCAVHGRSENSQETRIA